LCNTEICGIPALIPPAADTGGERLALSILKAFLIGGAVIIALLGLVEGIARIGKASFLKSVVLGQDNRTSTSKTFVFMWTLLVGWALVTMLIVGELIEVHGCVGPLTTAAQVTSAIKTCSDMGDQVGLLQIGWHNFIASGLSGDYLVLLGIPASAAVAAKAITQSKDDSGTAPKTPAPKNTGNITNRAMARVSQIFSADDGTTDIGDFQYVVFNLVTAVYFVAEFVRPSTQGLPVIPATLLGLTSVSAALYVGKKAATRTQPTITGVFPSILRADTVAVITGSGLTADPSAPPTDPKAKARVFFNDTESLDVVQDTIAGTLKAKVPAGLVSGSEPVSGTVQAFNVYGAATPGFTVQLSPAQPQGDALANSAADEQEQGGG
jgi:hypothetical protein